MAHMPLVGSLRILFLYDVCEEIRTEELRTLLAGEGPGVITERRRDPAFHHPSPDYVRFERPPVGCATAWFGHFEKRGLL